MAATKLANKTPLDELNGHSFERREMKRDMKEDTDL
jgi:hypothetical protein